MKRLIYLITSDKIKHEDLFKQFRNDLKQFSFINIIQEISTKRQVLIEFPDDKYQEVYDGLRKLDVVEIIDSILPENT